MKGYEDTNKIKLNRRIISLFFLTLAYFLQPTRL
jgi:hypothetical protein